MSVMTTTPPTQYAWNGDVSLAYQVVGSGPIDLLYLQGWASHVDLNWESPALTRFLTALSAQSRLIVTDRRGWGASDRFSPFDIAPLETLTEDLIAVLDAAGSERAVIYGTQECSIIACYFAATYPGRTRGLILTDPWYRYLYDEISGEVISGDALDAVLKRVHDGWGRPAWVGGWQDARERDWYPRFARSAIPPGGLIAEMLRYRGGDPSAVYPTIHTPTLVLSVSAATPMGDMHESGRKVAASIPGARLVEHDQAEEAMWPHWKARGSLTADEIARFLRELRDEDAILDRVLATLLFTDIVDSTSRAAAAGDSGWADLLTHHRATVRAIFARLGGQEVDTAGDGFFARFDGPGRAIRAAQAIIDASAGQGLDVRASVHTGECELVDGKPQGITVSVGARICGLAGRAEVLVSDTVRNLVAGSGLGFVELGAQRLKGVPDEILIYRVVA